MLESANIFVTGGAGTLGHAIARRRKQDGWTGHLTVFSTDTHKHGKMEREYPDISFVQGDIRNPDTLFMAMAGHDVVIHAAAVKVIPVSELYSIDTFDVNVNGSQCVCSTALRARIKHLIAISTDKAAHAANAYGASKYLMEKLVQEYSRQDFETQFHLVRFGNVLESNGSVIEFWKKAVERGEKIKITDPNMSRFWLSPSQAVQYIIDALECPSGCIYIPRIPALSIGKLAEYVLWNEPGGDWSKVEKEIIPIRPGEKMHETLLTEEEGWYALKSPDAFVLAPTTAGRFETAVYPYSSDIAEELTKLQLAKLLDEG
jgi:UDP-N-acetylglucosamine 4,6-dehydratase